MSITEPAAASQPSPFWTFSLGYYRGAGVSEACLELQDNCGVDVNVVLFLLWMASQKRMLAADQVKVAGVFGTPIEEPWVNQIHVALLKAKTDLGGEYIWSENVKASDFGRVLREHAEKGANLVMGDAFTDEDASRRAAKIVRGLKQALTEDDRFAVADDVVAQLKEHGDPWRLSEQARPKTGPRTS